MIAIGCGLMFAAAAHCAAALAFNERLVYGRRYDQLVADKQVVQGHMHPGGMASHIPSKEVEGDGRVPIQAFSTEP